MMMMTPDWQDKLKALKMTMPEDLADDSASDSAAAASTGARQAAQQQCPRLDIVLERKGRAGKSATIVCGFPESMPDEDIASLASVLRKRLGTGGSARGGEILIQGDRRADVLRLLQAEGYKARII